MADEKETPKTNGKSATKEAIVKSQTSYKGNNQAELVDVKIIKDGNHYKQGDVDKVHPTTAAILKAKGLISFIFLFALMAFATTVAKAQNDVTFSKITASNDTITNTGTDSMIVTFTNPGANHYNVVTIWPVYTRLSGTAAGTMKLYERGTTSGPWIQVSDTSGLCTFTLTNVASQGYKWTIRSGAVVKQYMIVTTGGTTVSAIASANVILNKW